MGLTHNKQDHKLSVASTAWGRQETLQEPCDFMRVLEHQIVPTHSRKLIVKKLEGLFDWQEFFEPWHFQYHAIAASHQTPVVCHSKRFVSRKDLAQMELPGWELQTPQGFENLEKVGGMW